MPRLFILSYCNQSLRAAAILMRLAAATTLVGMSNVSASAQSTEYQPLFTSSNFSKTIDVSKPVGMVEGAQGVSSTGVATSAIPIGIPPAAGRVAPQLSVAYSSQAGDGVMGWGWSLRGGTPVIALSPKN